MLLKLRRNSRYGILQTVPQSRCEDLNYTCCLCTRLPLVRLLPRFMYMRLQLVRLLLQQPSPRPSPRSPPVPAWRELILKSPPRTLKFDVDMQRARLSAYLQALLVDTI